MPDDEVAPLDLHREVLARDRVGRAELELDLLGVPLAHEQAVVLADVLDDRGVHLVARDPDRLAVDDAGQRHHRDLGGAAADVDDHVGARLGHRQPAPSAAAIGSSMRNASRAPACASRLTHRPLLDLGDAGRHA